jgi:hypothetical protein
VSSLVLQARSSSKQRVPRTRTRTRWFALSVAVGEGRDFVVPGRRRYRHSKLIVTAAYCPPGLPPLMGPRIPRSGGVR